MIDAGRRGNGHRPADEAARAAARHEDGKPRIVYMGAEYCPYCATERWAMVNALSRFGTFSNLKITTSAAVTSQGSPEVVPEHADVLVPRLEVQERLHRVRAGRAAGQLATSRSRRRPPSRTTSLTKYDVPPYVGRRAGAIPFIDFANQYVISGAIVRRGRARRTRRTTQIADAMNDPSTDIAKGAVGAANVHHRDDLQDHRQQAGQRLQRPGDPGDPESAADRGANAGQVARLAHLAHDRLHRAGDEVRHVGRGLLPGRTGERRVHRFLAVERE